MSDYKAWHEQLIKYDDPPFMKSELWHLGSCSIRTIPRRQCGRLCNAAHQAGVEIRLFHLGSEHVGRPDSWSVDDAWILLFLESQKDIVMSILRRIYGSEYPYKKPGPVRAGNVNRQKVQQQIIEETNRVA